MSYRCTYPFHRRLRDDRTSPLITIQSREKRKPGSAEKVFRGVKLNIDNPDPHTGTEKILVREPNGMQDCIDDKQATAALFKNGDWMIPGDQGYLDENGYLFIKGSSNNVIIGPSGEISPRKSLNHLSPPRLSMKSSCMGRVQRVSAGFPRTGILLKSCSRRDMRSAGG